MPLSGPSAPQGVPSNRNHAMPSKKKSSGQVTGFTFVDQSADLRSIADKKIVDSDQRHLIRSHVMQKVRKDERLQGKKRPTGRDSNRKDSGPPAMSASPTEASSPGGEALETPSSQTDLNWDSPASSVSPSPRTQLQKVTKVPYAPSQGLLDPFSTLPGGQNLSRVVDQLIQYCFHKFIPMTFPIDVSTPREYNNWRLKILSSQSANTATFFGMMAMVAAHQAIINGRHKDLRPSSIQQRPSDLLIDEDFAMMKTCALQATQERISRNGWDGPTVEAIFGLIGAEHILGNFEEARFHLTALKKFFVNVKWLDPASPASNFIPLTDVKGAIGTMGRPLFRLPWDPEPIPQELLEKLYQWHAPEVAMLGTAFGEVNSISLHLQTILQQATVLCRFCQFNATRNNELTAKEYESFRRKTLELEYDVLAYVYPGSPTDVEQTPTEISTDEQIARLAVLGFTSSNITKVLPSLGVGRALTHHQNTATQTFYASLKKAPGRITAQFIVWALMVFAQCAHGQPEERHFVTSLAWYSQWAGIRDWVTLESVCATFLYVPAYQCGLWQEIWGKACRLQQARLDDRPHAAVPIRSQNHQLAVRGEGV